jgi:hypothetical protein
MVIGLYEISVQQDEKIMNPLSLSLWSGGAYLIIFGMGSNES